MFQKISNILFWVMICVILGYDIYCTIRTIIRSLLTQSFYYIIFSVPPLITLLGFESYGISIITTTYLKKNQKQIKI